MLSFSTHDISRALMIVLSSILTIWWCQRLCYLPITLATPFKHYCVLTLTMKHPFFWPYTLPKFTNQSPPPPQYSLKIDDKIANNWTFSFLHPSDDHLLIFSCYISLSFSYLYSPHSHLSHSPSLSSFSHHFLLFFSCYFLFPHTTHFFISSFLLLLSYPTHYLY